MQLATKKGLSFGLTSGIITALGLMVGLHSGTESTKVVIGGLLVIAIADALSDALGMHMSEEEGRSSRHQVWITTITTFLGKMAFTLIFIIPILLLPLTTAVITCVIIGLILIGLLSFYIAKQRKLNPTVVIAKHLFITVLAVFLTHYLGLWVHNWH